MPRPAPGEIWRVDLGLTAKVRPCLVMSDYPGEDELALVLVIPHTTAVRRNRWEFACCQIFSKTRRFSFATNPACLAKPFGDKAWRSHERRISRAGQTVGGITQTELVKLAQNTDEALVLYSYQMRE